MSKRVLVILMLTSLLSLVTSPAPSVQGALFKEDIPLTVNWSADSYYQGDSGSVTISIEHNAGGSEVYILSLWISFWDASISLHSQEEPRIQLPANGFHTFGPAFFTVSQTAPVGWSELSVEVIYTEITITPPGPGLPGIVWTVTGWLQGEPTKIYIKENPYYEQTYLEVLSEVSNEISNTQRTDFECSEAISLFSKASDEYDLAISFANQEKWIDATTRLETASDFLTQASSEEVEYQINTWRKEASDAIDTANTKIAEITEWKSADAESLWQQAQTELLTSQNYFSQEILQGYQNAYDSASQAISYAEQAYSKEQTYLIERENEEQRQRLNLIGLGALGVFAVTIVVIILVLRRKKRGFAGDITSV